MKTKSNFIKLFFVPSLFLILSLFGCSKEELVCPEAEIEVNCIADDFIGDWEFVDWDHQVSLNSCLSGLVIKPDTTRDISITLPKDSLEGDIQISIYAYEIYSEQACFAYYSRSGSITIPTSGWPIHIPTSTEKKLRLVNSNYLIVSHKTFGDWVNKVYRRKN